MIYISLIKIGSGIQKLVVGDSDTQQAELMSLLSLFQNKESRLKIYFRL
jgi:hypothetical protein